MARVILDWDPKYKKAVVVSEFLENIRGRFSIPNEGKAILDRQGKSTWNMPDFLSPITNTGRFGIGLYFDIRGFLDASDIEFDIITTQPLQDQLIQSYSWSGSYNIKPLSLPLRPYQEKAIKKAVHMGYGNCIIGTAGGKTLVMASIIETVRQYETNPFTTLLVLPSNLVRQTYKEFLEYGVNESDMVMWDGDNAYSKASIILVSAESLKSNLITYRDLQPHTEFKWNSIKKKKQDTYAEYLEAYELSEKLRKKEWNARRKHILKELTDVDLMLIDEVHGLRKDNVINKALNLFETRHRFGFTGTLPEDLLDQWNILGNIGPILVDVNSAVLRELGYIAQLKAQIINVHYKNPPYFKLDKEDNSKAYVEECDFLYHSEYRNKVISHLTTNFEKNTLIIVDKIDHGETLEAILKQQTNKDVYFIRGSVEMADREKLRELMETNNNIICIAMSRIFAVGINIKNLHYVIFAQGGKAKVTIIQSIGRGLRLHEDKECLLLIDIADDTHYGQKHLFERLSYYEDEQIEYNIKELFE
jgi:superfamily II DNA or RNA helicase